MIHEVRSTSVMPEFDRYSIVMGLESSNPVHPEEAFRIAQIDLRACLREIDRLNEVEKVSWRMLDVVEAARDAASYFTACARPCDCPGCAVSRDLTAALDRLFAREEQ